MKHKALFRFAGALFAASVFVFADGCIDARKSPHRYDFSMWLPQITGICAVFLLLFVNPQLVADGHSEYGEASDVQKAKSLFFMGVLLCFASVGTALWKLIDCYSSAPSAWPGVALVVQSLLIVACNAVMFYARSISSDEMDF